MPETKPEISIGMPVYNAEKYLQKAIESILNQTFDNWELIISDNASTDDTGEISRKYAAIDSRIKYFRNEQNMGAARNYSQAFKFSSGKYFKWAAADDYFSQQMFEHCVAVLKENADVVLCYPRTKIIDENDEVIVDYEKDIELVDPDPVDRFLRLNSLLRECNAVFGLIRRDVLKNTVLIANYIASDNVLLHQLSLFGKFQLLDNAVFYRREHPHASSWNKSIKSQLEFFDPQLVNRTVFPQWRKLYSLFHVVNHSPLILKDKMKLSVYLLRKAFWIREKLWRDIHNVYRN